MTHFITVREHARLTASSINENSLDRAGITPSAFDWLCKLNASFGSGASIVEVEDRRWLRMNNYVGIIRTPCGTQIEILPKHHDGADDIPTSRTLLIRMVANALDLRPREVGTASLQSLHGPLSEWIYHQFLQALDILIKRGLRFEYFRTASCERFLSGQLDIARQLRAPPSRRHLFEINHDVFSANRPENRLLKRALDRVCRTTNCPTNWKLAHELRERTKQVPISIDITGDFAKWANNRLMADYKFIKQWCELILKEINPVATYGEREGISLLFPMERLFELNVAKAIRKRLVINAVFERAPVWHSLCSHDGKNLFGLEPDMVVSLDQRHWILDAKWKLIDTMGSSKTYNLKQSDFYQLFTYGHKYLESQAGGDMILIYPKRRDNFASPLPVFQLTDSLRLWVVPFDLDRGALEHCEGANLPMSSDRIEP